MGIKYKVNSNFFQKWSPKMAYVLGYIYADGSLEDASYLRGKYLRISSKDKEILLKIKKVLGSEHNLQIRPPQLTKHKNGLFLSKELYLLRIGDHKIFDNLLNLGITPRKSLTLKFPKVPQDQLLHFIRGYFDGDGSVYTTRENFIKLAFTCGSKIFLQQLANKIHEQIGIAKKSPWTSHNSFELRYNKRDALKILVKLYADNKGLFLNRKYKIYNKYINKMASCPSS